MKTFISRKGRIVIPAEFRKHDNIQPGQAFEIERVNKGEYRLVLAELPPKNQGLVDTLLACPVKGWFVSIESESAGSVELPS